mgnify:FL=1
MKTILLASIFFLFISASFAQQRADIAVPRTDKNSMLAHEQLLEKAKKGRIDLYFLGDSITRRWGTSDEQYKKFYENWKQNFWGWNAGNFGWGGDTTQNVQWRLENGELDNVNPKVIVLSIGTNNIGKTPPISKPDSRIEDVSKGIKAILNICQQKAPNARIILMSIFPRNDNIEVMPTINAINKKISKFADRKKIKFIDVTKKMADKNGKLLAGITVSDGLHLDVKGYQVWADAIKPTLKKWLGKPAKDDLAPPPTGDPSAKK